MEDAAIADRALLHARDTLPALLRILLQGLRSLSLRLQTLCQHGRILDRHAGTLCQKRAHRMGGIAQQGDLPLRHFTCRTNRRAVAERPQAPGLDGICQSAHRQRRMLQGCAQMTGIGRMVPILQILRSWSPDHDHHIQVAAAPHRVLHRMQIRSEPRRDLPAAQAGRQRGLRYQCPVGQNAAVTRLGLARPLDVRGTAFQQRVWQALREIPAGQTASYAQVAEQIGKPSAVRAVAQACAANALAVAIPCHRVVRNDGALSGYRWGVERKRALLDREAAA